LGQDLVLLLKAQELARGGHGEAAPHGTALDLDLTSEAGDGGAIERGVTPEGGAEGTSRCTSLRIRRGPVWSGSWAGAEVGAEVSPKVSRRRASSKARAAGEWMGATSAAAPEDRRARVGPGGAAAPGMGDRGSMPTVG
jgi:hypothetical protein